jgi:Na+/phosphate symporter
VILQQQGEVMSDKVENKRRELSFRVIGEDKKPEVAIPFETAASPVEVRAYVEGMIARLEEVRRLGEAHPNIKRFIDRRSVHSFTIYMADNDTGNKIEIYTLSYVDKKPRNLLENSRNDMRQQIESLLELQVGDIYKAMVAYMRKKNLGIKKISDARWREVCAIHPLYLSFWSEQRKRQFEKTAKRSIEKGMSEGRYVLARNATERVLSTKKSDEKASIQKRSVKRIRV